MNVELTKDLYIDDQNTFEVVDDVVIEDLRPLDLNNLPFVVDSENCGINVLSVIEPSTSQSDDFIIHRSSSPNRNTQISEKYGASTDDDERDADYNLDSEDDSVNDNIHDIPAVAEAITEENATSLNEDQLRDEDQNEGVVVDHGDMMEGRKRSINPKVENWAKNKTKKLRMEGKAYIGYNRAKDGKVTHKSARNAREIGPRCDSKECLRIKSRHCSAITEQNRQILFEYFWTKMNWDQRKVFVINHVKKVETKRTYTKRDESRRKFTLQYNLTVDNEMLQVCKNMFLKTLCLGEYSVQDWVRKGNSGMINSSENSYKSKKPSRRQDKDDDKVHLGEFFNSLPKLPSHYGRSSSSKLYLETTIHNVTQLYNLYQEKCSDEGKSPLSRTVFTKMFYSMNLSIYPIKKDKCDICTQHEVGQLSDERWNYHRKRKDRAREEKNRDTEEVRTTKKGRILTMDLQAVKVCPFVQASAIFFKLKLCCHNFTVYDNVSHQATCFWFTELDADMTASSFASCLLTYLQEHCKNECGPIIIYSDGCTYQNRNATLANALLNYSVDSNTEIIQKFLEVGHTQMECDSVHSCIERKSKGRDIHLPSDYLRISREARNKPNPYEVKSMHHTDFKNFTVQDFHRYKSIRPGKVRNIFVPCYIISILTFSRLSMILW